MDPKTGRFKRVSACAAEVRRLRGTAEGMPITPGTWSSGELTPTPTIGRYQSFVDSGLNRSELPFQSPIKEDEEEQPAQEILPEFTENPTLARLSGERNWRIGRAGEVTQLVNGADMEVMEPKMYDSLFNDYHSMGQMIDPLCKANKAVEVLCKGLEKDALEVTGTKLISVLNSFVRNFMTLLSCGAYPAVMTIMHTLSKWDEPKHGGTLRFTLSRKILKVWREYAFSRNGDELEMWMQNCRSGKITGMLGEGAQSTYGSYGFKRLCVKDEGHADRMDYFLIGLTEFLGFVEVGDHSALKAYNEFYIDVAVEAASGKPHGNRQPEDMDWEHYLESFESKQEFLEEEIEITGDYEYDMSERQIVMLLKEGMSRKMWVAVDKVLDDKRVLWKSLDLEAAKVICNEAKKDKAIKGANFKEFRSFGAKKAGARGGGSGGSAGSGGSGGSGGSPAGAKGEGAAGANGEGVVKRKHSYSCRFDRVGLCKNGADCLFQHDSDKGSISMMTDAGSEGLPKPSGVRDPQLGPRSNGSVLMMIGDAAAVVEGASTQGAVMGGAEASYTEHSRYSGSPMAALQGGQPVSAVGVEPVDDIPVSETIECEEREDGNDDDALEDALLNC